MTKLRTLLLCWLLALTGARVEAALFGGERKAFEAASESFRVDQWERAEKELAEFIRDYPKSERLTEAILLQAQAQYRQGKFTAVTELLEPRVGEAGNFADQFLYWIGEAQFAGTNYSAAALTFGKVAREFPMSPKRLEVAVNEAESLAKLGDWSNVAELLRRTNGPFRQAVLSAAKGDEMVARGFVLLARAHLEQKKYADTEAVLNKVGEGLSPDLDWLRRHLLCRMLAESGRAEEAARESAGMITAAENAHQNPNRLGLMADSVVFRADLLEQLGRLDEAKATLRLNLTNAPVARQRQALKRITALAIQQNQLDEAIRTLEWFLNQHTNAAAADVAWLTLGELHLKQHVGKPADGTQGGVTNHLEVATNCFQRVLKGFPGSVYVGKAQLNLGWCYWVEGQFTESEAAFDLAVKRLPASEDRAVAQFKLADAQFAQSNYPAALANYREVLGVTNGPAGNGALRTPASYQVLRASLALTNAAAAEEAMREILRDEPASAEAIGGVLLVAQGYLDANRPAEAQRLFSDFLRQFPESDLQPEVELLVARMQEEQGDWSGVAVAYDAWLGRYGTNRLRPQVEFQRALAAGAGNETNALRRFTNFVAQFPTHELAQRAQWWVADWFYQQRNFQNAEINYKQLFNNWPKSELAYEARMMAGRAAVGWSGFQNAIEHFISLTSDTNCPVPVRVQALFAYGGALMLWSKSPANTNKLESWDEARKVFREIPPYNPTNSQAAAAWGELGNCYLQLATADPNYYGAASNAYQQAFSIAAASGATRSQAKLGLASVLEKQAQLSGEARVSLLKQARDHDLDVYWGKHLGGEPPDLTWKGRAGMEAARLSELLNEWPQAVKLYQDMLREQLFPAEKLERKLGKLRETVAPGSEN